MPGPYEEYLGLCPSCGTQAMALRIGKKGCFLMCRICTTRIFFKAEGSGGRWIAALAVLADVLKQEKVRAAYEDRLQKVEGWLEKNVHAGVSSGKPALAKII